MNHESPILEKTELNRVVSVLDKFADEMEHVLFGKRDLIELTILGILGSRAYFIGSLPGLGKTELVKVLAKASDVSSTRI